MRMQGRGPYGEGKGGARKPPGLANAGRWSARDTRGGCAWWVLHWGAAMQVTQGVLGLGCVEEAQARVSRRRGGSSVSRRLLRRLRPPGRHKAPPSGGASGPKSRSRGTRGSRPAAHAERCSGCVTQPASEVQRVRDRCTAPSSRWRSKRGAEEEEPLTLQAARLQRMRDAAHSPRLQSATVHARPRCMPGRGE